MKKSLVLLAGLALILGACANKKEKEELNADSLKIAELSEDYQEATNFNDSLMLLMGDIYTGLDSINAQEGLLYNLGNGENPNRREEIRQNLANIKARLNANKALLNEMEQKIKDGNNKNGVLTKTIEQLKSHIAQQDQKIAKLESDLSAAKGQITELNSQVATAQEQVKTETAAKEQAQQETVAAENQLNKVYYAIGTNKELKKNGLLEKKFLSSTKVLKGDYNLSYFTTADKRTLSTIPTNSKKLKVWTNMPAGSYQIVDNADGTKTLKITDPNKFWSLTPYLILQVD
ncbi:MAG: hypothetical protein NC201_04910 [Prevotella sp.]|nr:hypothetical protein [Bacteroides sp.]MCM1366570.1 hypothetical protein [Prevotella sp.]MCM1437239.1 hypothetical protein [Prevotella sp.]